MAEIEQVSQVIDLIAMSMCKPRFCRLFAYPEEVGDAIRAAMKDTAIRARILQSAWRPIEAAPKDGHDVLITELGSGHPVRIGFWDTANGGIWSIWPGRERAHPTHWQPLPLPPTGGEHGRG